MPPCKYCRPPIFRIWLNKWSMRYHLFVLIPDVYYKPKILLFHVKFLSCQLEYSKPTNVIIWLFFFSAEKFPWVLVKFEISCYFKSSNILPNEVYNFYKNQRNLVNWVLVKSMQYFRELILRNDFKINYSISPCPNSSWTLNPGDLLSVFFQMWFTQLNSFFFICLNVFVSSGEVNIADKVIPGSLSRLIKHSFSSSLHVPNARTCMGKNWKTE